MSDWLEDVWDGLPFLPFGVGWLLIGGVVGFVLGVLVVLWLLIFVVGPRV